MDEGLGWLSFFYFLETDRQAAVGSFVGREMRICGLDRLGDYQSIRVGLPTGGQTTLSRAVGETCIQRFSKWG